MWCARDYGSMFATPYRRTEEEEREYKRRRAEAARRRRQNLSEEQKAAERERNAAAARLRRLHQTEEQRAAERERHRARRANPQIRAAERERDAEARRRRRANPHLRAAERAKRRERRLAEGVRPSLSRRQRRAKAAARRDRRQASDRRRASSSPSPPPQAAVWTRSAAGSEDCRRGDLVLDDFGPLCSACDRLCFRHDVSAVSPRHVQTLQREFPDEENVEDFVLCQACRDSLEAGSVYLVARRNGYAYPPMPEWLTIISSDEEEQPVGCIVHDPMPAMLTSSTQTDVVIPLCRRVDIAIGSSWVDDRGVSRSTQTPTSSSIAAKVHSWTATESRDLDSLPEKRRSLRKRASGIFT